MPDIHIFDNGIRLHTSHLIHEQVERYASGPNLHEPVEEEWIARLAGGMGRGKGRESEATFVDVGAAVGYYCFLVHKLNPTIELHAFEPDAENRRKLAENAELNGVDGIKVHEEAIAARTGTAALAGSGFVAYITPQRSAGPQVPTTTIDDVAASLGGIGLLKMDIQGGEAEALMGAEQSLRNRAVKNWVIGTHSPEIHRFCVGAFTRHNHRILFEAARVEHQPDGIIVAATGKR